MLCNLCLLPAMTQEAIMWHGQSYKILACLLMLLLLHHIVLTGMTVTPQFMVANPVYKKTIPSSRRFSHVQVLMNAINCHLSNSRLCSVCVCVCVCVSVWGATMDAGQEVNKSGNLKWHKAIKQLRDHFKIIFSFQKWLFLGTWLGKRITFVSFCELQFSQIIINTLFEFICRFICRNRSK